MSKNMGIFDRAARGLIAAALLFVAFGTSAIGSGLLFWIAVVVAAVFVLTALVGNCPLYRIVGLRTCEEC